MTAPPRIRRNPGTPARATSATTTVATGKSTAATEDFDYDKRVVAQVDWSIWNAIFNGQFRLAVPCDVCGRWLTAGASKRAHRGPRCAAKAVAS